MATLLDPPKPTTPAKVDEFVEKQINAARRRYRVLDFFLTGLKLAVASLVLLLIALLVDRYAQTPRGAGWALFAGYLALATGFVYVTLFRSNRREINPYFAASQVEANVPNAKNSLVTWVDFAGDEHLPGSIRTAIGHKAARDLKGVDLNRVIENRWILWLALVAGVLLLLNTVLAFLPPTRTELSLEEPKKGDITVFSNQEVAFQVRVRGRIPGTNDSDAVRLRMWYNADDPGSYEERALKAAEDDRRRFSVIVPAKQVRNGFRYRILAGNAQTDDYTVTSKIIPEFKGFDVSYDYPAYLKRAPETANDANLLAPFGTTVTIVATANREIKHGHIEIDGRQRTLDGSSIEGRPDAIQFKLVMEKESTYRIWFTTPEGDKNQDPARFKIGVIDPKPIIRNVDIAYEYPAYLRFKTMLAAEVREPVIEAPRGTKIVLTARTSRGVKDAKVEVPGQPAIMGVPVTDEPTWVRFDVPALMQEGNARITFSPTTAENPGNREIPVRILLDQTPHVQIDDPKELEKELPANGTLEVKGLATDDHGVDKMSLHFRVIAAEDKYLQPKLYRGGLSFQRKQDNSWPTRVEYQDFVKLPDLRMVGNPNWRATAGAVIECWLEAVDNCTIPEPNRNISDKKRIKITATLLKEDERRKIDQQNQKLDQQQRAHEKKQDAKNATEKRDDPKQPPPPGAEQKKDNTGGDATATGEQGPMPKEANAQPKDGQPTGERGHDRASKDIENALRKTEQEKQPGNDKPDHRPDPAAKVDPSEARPNPKKDANEQPAAENRATKNDPNNDMMGEGSAGAARTGAIDKTKEEKATDKPAGSPMMDMSPDKSEAKPSYGGGSQTAGQTRPEAKDATKPMNGESPEKPVARGTARQEQKKGDVQEPQSSDRIDAGTNKPDQEVTTANKKPAGETSKSGPAPTETAADKPRETPETGTTRPQPKKDSVADAGGSRSVPKDSTTAGGVRQDKQPVPGSNEEARSGSKPGPQTPGDQGAQPQELSREIGELAREINSGKPELSDEAKEDVDRLYRNPETRQKTREELEKLERNASDESARKKAQDLRKRGEQAARNYDSERPNPENVDQLAKKLGSKDERERQEAQQRIKDWSKDQQAREDLKKETDELKKKNRSAGEKVEQAMNQAEQARNNESPKVDEKQLADLAKNLNSTDEKTKTDAQKRLDKMMQDPKTRDQAQDKLKEMAKNAADKDKQDLENAAKAAEKSAQQFAGKDTTPKENQKVDQKELADTARKLADGDAKAQQEAKEKLQQLAKDPKTAKEMQDQLRKMADNAKTPAEKKALEDAAKEAGKLAEQMAKKDAPKLNPDDIRDMAKKMAGADAKAKEGAQKKLEQLMSDPKTREQALKALEEMAKNAKNNLDEQKAFDDAMKQAQEMARQSPSKLDPKNLKDLAERLDKLDDKAKQELRQKFDETMKDPKNRDELKKLADEVAKNSTPEQKKQFDDLLRQLGGGSYVDDGKPDPADPRNKLKAAELMLEKFKKNITNEEFAKQLGWTDDQKAKWVKDQEATIEALRRQSEKGEWAIDRNKVAPGTGGLESIKADPKSGNDPLRGGQYAPPPGYVDPYKKFTGTEPKR